MIVNKVLLSTEISIICAALGKTRRPKDHRNYNRALLATENTKPVKENGSENCPCISLEEKNRVVLKVKLKNYLPPNVNVSSYGVGCDMHDLNSQQCKEYTNCLSSRIYVTDECEDVGCNKYWCFIDKDNCNLMYNQSLMYRNSYYSYATCGYIDIYNNPYDYSHLNGTTIRVALNSNTGGWKGAYNPEGSFAQNDLWYGPLVDFVDYAALEGGFNINLTRPPEWIQNYSEDYFARSSLFDYCTYAVALGYIDLCVSAYSLLNERTKITSFFEIDKSDLYVYVKNNAQKSTWAQLQDNMLKIFLPFTTSAWICILVYLFLLGLVMLLHEYNNPVTSCPREVKIYSRTKDGKYKMEMKKVPLYKYVANSFFQSFLTVTEQAFGQNVYSLGGKIHLLGMSFFALVLVALYTANITAILTTNIQNRRINNLQDAINNGYNFCGTRTISERITRLYHLNDNVFVPDPVSLGGDGKPGFTCPNCNSRSRVFEFMRYKHNDKALYCNAAISRDEDLAIYQNRGEFCDVVRIGEPLASDTYGLPINKIIFPALSTMFHAVKNSDYLTELEEDFKPRSICQNIKEDSPLNPMQLSGLWMLTSLLVLVGLLVKWIRGIFYKMNPSRLPILCCNQWGEPAEFEIDVDEYEMSSSEAKHTNTMDLESGSLTPSDSSSEHHCQEQIKSSSETF